MILDISKSKKETIKKLKDEVVKVISIANNIQKIYKNISIFI